ncbi:Serine/threonine-protein kinase TOR, partial [Linum grandiflorum]
MVVTLNQILFYSTHLYWEIDPSELDFSNKLCHDWDGKKWKTGDLRDTWNATEPLAIMALPAILNNSNNLELMWKSESEVFHIIESAITVAALRWPEKLLAQKQRIFRPYNMACRYSSTNDDGGYNSTAYNQEITKEEEEEPVYNQEITKEEEEPTKPRRRIIRIKLVKDGKPTTATTVGSGMGANLKMASDVPWSNSEEYEKKLENSKRKLKEGYSKFEDSRKRSKLLYFRYEKLPRWDDALRAYTVKASQASSLHLVLEAILGMKWLKMHQTVFNVHVPRFVDAIWVALRHPTLQVRERAVEALRACLKVIEKRETRWRVEWYYRMFEATQDGLGKNAPVHSIHGSLIAVGELLRLGHELLEFARESVIVYLDDEDCGGTTRTDAALCCCKLVANSFSSMGSAQFGSSRSNRSGGKRRRHIEELVEKLLIAAVADADVNDFDVREYSILVAGRLSEKNPAYVLPALRRHLIQLLTYLEQ